MSNTIIKLMKEPLWNRNFILIFFSNLLMAFSFYLLMPTIPVYLSEVLRTPASQVGIVLSSYTIAILFVRPFSGFLVDRLPRKTLFLFAGLFFWFAFFGYLFAATVMLLVLVRFLHGLGWGVSTVAGSTIAIDVIPASRRGEGMGYFGLTLNIAMAAAPLFGTLLYEKWGISALIYGCLASAGTGLLIAGQIGLARRTPSLNMPLSFDRFILVKGIPAGVSFIFCALPYGMLVSYITLFGREIEIEKPALFFVFLALGVGISRLISGRLVDKGYIHRLIMGAMVALMLSLALLSTVHDVMVFCLSASLIGVSYGTMTPAFQYLFVALAPSSMRGTANSTYLLSFDVGLSLGMLSGGFISSFYPLSTAYLLCTGFIFLALVLYAVKVRGHFNRNRVDIF